MGIRVESIDGITVLTPEGDMDLTTLPAFEARVATLLANGARVMVWDLDAVGILPSTACGFLLQTAKRLGAVGGRMALACGHPRVRATLRTMGVLELFRTYPTRAEALAGMARD